MAPKKDTKVAKAAEPAKAEEKADNKRKARSEAMVYQVGMDHDQTGQTF